MDDVEKEPRFTKSSRRFCKPTTGAHRTPVVSKNYSFTQPPFCLDEAMQASTKATPLTPSSMVG